MLMTSAQCRAGRALVGWTQPKLADAASLGLSTVVDFERSRREVSEDAVSAMAGALSAAGVLFIDANGEGPGVRLRKSPTMEPRPNKAGNTWFVLLTWPSGEPEHVNEFATEAEAETWIRETSPSWLAKRWAGGED